MEQHIRILAILYIIFGILGLVGAVVVLVVGFRPPLFPTFPESNCNSYRGALSIPAWRNPMCRSFKSLVESGTRMVCLLRLGHLV